VQLQNEAADLSFEEGVVAIKGGGGYLFANVGAWNTVGRDHHFELKFEIRKGNNGGAAPINRETNQRKLSLCLWARRPDETAARQQWPQPTRSDVFVACEPTGVGLG
jgi:hypothetical protein